MINYLITIDGTDYNIKARSFELAHLEVIKIHLGVDSE